MYKFNESEILKAIEEEMKLVEKNPSKLRLCAICLTAVLRDTHTEHMELVHGYETLEVRSQDVISDAS